jgi:hypothetical protein
MSFGGIPPAIAEYPAENPENCRNFGYRSTEYKKNFNYLLRKDFRNPLNSPSVVQHQQKHTP